MTLGRGWPQSPGLADLPGGVQGSDMPLSEARDVTVRQCIARFLDLCLSWDAARLPRCRPKAICLSGPMCAERGRLFV